MNKPFTFFTAWLPLLLSIVLPVWAYVNFDSYIAIFQNERAGLMEWEHALFPFFAAIIVIGILLRHFAKLDWLLVCYLVIMTVGCIYLAGEELSWGQHLLRWETSEHWKQLNSQNETNLHNNSYLLNLLPRTILIIAIVLGATLFQWILKNRRELIPERALIVYPPATLLMCAILILVWEVIIQIGNNVDISAVLPLHDGEVQEVFIVWAVLLYALELRKRFAQSSS